MTTEQIREYVSKSYPSDSWRFKVSRMPDSQVFAIYKRLLAKPPQAKKPKPAGEQYEQLAMDI